MVLEFWEEASSRLTRPIGMIISHGSAALLRVCDKDIKHRSTKSELTVTQPLYRQVLCLTGPTVTPWEPWILPGAARSPTKSPASLLQHRNSGRTESSDHFSTTMSRSLKSISPDAATDIAEEA